MKYTTKSPQSVLCISQSVRANAAAAETDFLLIFRNWETTVSESEGGRGLRSLDDTRAGRCNVTHEVPARPTFLCTLGHPSFSTILVDVSNVYEQVAWYQARGLVDEEVDPAAFIDLSFVEGHFDVPK